MSDPEDAIPHRMLEWCAAAGRSPFDVPFGDVYPELRLGELDFVDWRVLPKRAHSFLSTAFPRWSSLAETTVSDLFIVTHVGHLTVKLFLAELDRRSEIGALLSAALEPSSANGQIPAVIRELAAQRLLVDGYDVLRRWATWWDRDGTITLRDLLEGTRVGVPADVLVALDRVLDSTLQRIDVDAPQQDPAETVRANIDERLFDILRRRRWVSEPDTLEEIGAAYDITRERIRQLQNAGLAEVNRVANGVDELRWSIDYVRSSLGEVAPSPAVVNVMGQLGVDHPSTSSWLLLDLAGDYELGAAGFLYARGFDLDMVLHDIETLEEADDGLDAVAAGELLAAHGLADHAIEPFLQSVAGLRRFGGRWFGWKGGAGDKAAVVLGLRNEPATVQQIVDDIGENYSRGTLTNAMSTDDRFVRTSKALWGLARWGRAEYKGIVGGMLERIDANGGSMSLAALVEDMVQAFKISANSVHAYASTLEFVVEAGGVRRRTSNDDWPFRTALSTARGTFAVGDSIRVLFPVTFDALRGSGQMIPEATSAALGVRPKGAREYVNDAGSRVSLRWHASSVTGPAIGSIRPFINEVGGELGDHVVLTFDTVGLKVSTVLLKADLGPAACLSALVGASPTEVAASIGVAEEDVFECLRSRGDSEVIDWLLSI